MAAIYRQEIIQDVTLFTSKSAAAFYDKLFSSLDFTLTRAATGRRGFPKECTFLADKGYDAKSIYNTVKTVYEGEAFIPLNPRSTKASKTLPAGNPVCEAGFAMHRTVKRPTMGVPGRNTAAHSASLRLVFAPVTTRTGTTGRIAEAARNTRPFQTITAFPLTAAVSISSGLTPCGRNVSATIPASNPQVRNACGCGMVQARRTSTHWPTSPLYRLRWPPFCTALTPTVPPNSCGVPPNLSFSYLFQARGLPRCGFCALEMP